MTYVNTGSLSAIGIVFPILAIISMSVRIYSWRRSSRRFQLDDILIVPSCFLTVITGAAIVIGSQLRIIGEHSLPQITLSEQHNLGKFEYAFWIAHVITIGFIKLSLLFLFRSIFQGRSSRTIFDYTNWALIALVTTWTIIFLFFEIFACGTDPAASWASLYSLRHECVDTFALQTACAVFSWILDLAILIEPIFMIGTLNMTTSKKLQTSIAFLASTFAVVAGLLRMIIWIQIKVQDTTHLTTLILATNQLSADQEGVVSIILFWTYVEIGVGFQVACLLPCSWLLHKIHIASLVSKFRSLPSVVSFKKGRLSSGSRHDNTEETGTSDIQHTQSQNYDDEIELVAVKRSHIE
ncbi:hypothetical protein F5X98DRAFT_338050 [Xylaria grammica]|nr:hypothetical protein F5X98DRAFT_338050 [Xylaria grammica]